MLKSVTVLYHFKTENGNKRVNSEDVKGDCYCVIKSKDQSGFSMQMKGLLFEGNGYSSWF